MACATRSTRACARAETMRMGKRPEDNPKLQELNGLLSTWKGWLVALSCVAIFSFLAVASYAWQYKAELIKAEPALAAFATIMSAALGAIVLGLGHVFTKYAEFREQFIEIRNEIIDHEDGIRKRWIRSKIKSTGAASRLRVFLNGQRNGKMSRRRNWRRSCRN
jgi:hypothetical protein